MTREEMCLQEPPHVHLYTAPAGFKLVSGGQTGADRAGLDWAIAHGIPCGGWCPNGRKAEDGVIPERYPLQEAISAGYAQRTRWNVRDSDVTLIFTMEETLDGGSRFTAALADKLRKPFLHVYPAIDPADVVRFLVAHRPSTVNVAGRRASVGPGIADLVQRTLSQALWLPVHKSNNWKP